eukprot:1179866-Prorocentrum_minimum.AAC.3
MTNLQRYNARLAEDIASYSNSFGSSSDVLSLRFILWDVPQHNVSKQRQCNTFILGVASYFRFSGEDIDGPVSRNKRIETLGAEEVKGLRAAATATWCAD